MTDTNFNRIRSGLNEVAEMSPAVKLFLTGLDELTRETGITIRGVCALAAISPEERHERYRMDDAPFVTRK